MTPATPDAREMATPVSGTGTWSVEFDGAKAVVKVWMGTGECGWSSARVLAEESHTIFGLGIGDPPTSLSESLARLQSSGAFTNRVLATMLGVSPRTLTNWRQGDMPTAEHMRRLEHVSEIVALVAGFTAQETAFRVLSRMGRSSIVEDLASGAIPTAREKAEAFQRLRAGPLAGKRVPRRIVHRDSSLPHPLEAPELSVDGS